jgi:hypothetical protein
MPKAQALEGADLVPASKVRAPEPTALRSVPSADLVAMQFRMPAEFVEAFKVRAARRQMKLNELLAALFEASDDMSISPARLARKARQAQRRNDLERVAG